VNRLLTALGVDYAQWKALTIASLKLDMRAGSFGGARTSRNASGRKAIIGQAIFYGMLGVVMAMAIWNLGDRFVASTLLYSYTIVMVGTAMLVDHNTAITSPTDYGILGYQPVTSRTYFACKLTNALVYTFAMSTALAVLPAIALFIRYGIAVGVAGVLALYVCATAVTLAIVAGYTWLMQRVGTRRLQSALSYVQMATGLLVYGGFILTSGGVSRNTLAEFTIERTPWLMLYPATWFASWLELADGSTLPLDIASVIASIAIVAWLATRLRGRLSLAYSARLAELAATTSLSSSTSTALRPGRWFRTGEGRAVAILVRSHFRNDLKFRMGVLAVVPLTLVYLLLGLREAAAGSPAGPGGGSFSMVSIAVMLFPMLLKQHLAHSDSFRASWIFFSTPADRTDVIRSAKNVLLAFFLLPYLAFVGAALAFVTRDWGYVVVYLLLLGSLSHVALLMLTLIRPELPFSKPVEKARGSSGIIGAMVVVSILGAAVPFIARAVRVDTVATVVAFAVIAAVTLALDRLTRLRIERQAVHLEFQG
jgi:hypothetical protein